VQYPRRNFYLFFRFLYFTAANTAAAAAMAAAAIIVAEEAGDPLDPGGAPALSSPGCLQLPAVPGMV
jgi:di/tricarboxylate transporter